MTRAQAVVAALALAAVLACLYGIVEAGRRIYYSIGPSKAVATADGGLYLVSHGYIHVFGKDGVRRQAVSLESLGASLTPSDLAVHRDGRVVVANPDGSALERCKLPAGPCEQLEFGLTRVLAQVALPLNSVKVWIDDDRGRYYISDNAGHRLVIADFAGKVIASSTNHVVFYPNQLRLTAPGELTVVDTNHARVATFDVSSDRIGRVMRELPVAARKVARKGRRWPFDAAQLPSGETWVLVADDHMSNADLVVFDANGATNRRIDLGADSDPFDIELWGDRVIVADATNYRVEALTLDGRPVRAFNDAAFERELKDAKREPDMWRSVRVAAQLGIVLFPVLAILVLYRMGVPGLVEVRPPAVKAEPAALGTDPHWLDLDPALGERARKSIVPMTAFFAVLLAVFVLMFRGAISSSPGLALQFGLVCAVVVVFFVIGRRRPPTPPRQFNGLRVGASKRGLHFQLAKAQPAIGRKREGVAAWKDVFYDGKRLLADRTSIMVRNPLFGDLFEKGEFERWIVAHVPDANRMTPSQLEMRALRGLGAPAWIILAALAAIVAFVAWKFASL